MTRVLVTGGTGFIGRQVLPQLAEKGYDVHAVSSQPNPQPAAGVRWHNVDLLDPVRSAELIQSLRPEHLLHLAWTAVPGQFWTSSDNLRWVQASLGLIEVFARCNGKRVVIAGSCAEYDWTYGYCSELVTPCRPSTLYGVCKHALQSLITSFARTRELSVGWGRIFFVYGPREDPRRLVASVVRSLLQGRVAECSRGEQIRDFLHVIDVASAFVALLESAVEGPVNIASGHPVAVIDVVGQIGTKLGQTDLLRPGSIRAAADDPPLLIADIRRLRNEVGWAPSFPLSAGLDHTIAWWRRELTSAGT